MAKSVVVDLEGLSFLSLDLIQLSGINLIMVRVGSLKEVSYSSPKRYLRYSDAIRDSDNIATKKILLLMLEYNTGRAVWRRSRTADFYS